MRNNGHVLLFQMYVNTYYRKFSDFITGELLDGESVLEAAVETKRENGGKEAAE